MTQRAARTLSIAQQLFVGGIETTTKLLIEALLLLLSGGLVEKRPAEWLSRCGDQLRRRTD